MSATMLDPGTPLHLVIGYDPEFRLAAPVADGYRIYESDFRSSARVGADLFDIAGRVRDITLNSAVDGLTVLARIDDPVDVESRVTALLASPVDQSLPAPSGCRFFVRFGLADGTATVRPFWPELGRLFRGVLVPAAFGALLARYTPLCLADR